MYGLLARRRRILISVLSLTVLFALCCYNIRENHWVNRPSESTGQVPVAVLLAHPEKYEGRLVLISGTVLELYPSSSVLTLKNANSKIMIHVMERDGVSVGDDITVYGSVLLVSKGYVDAIWVYVHHHPKMWLYLSACGLLVLVYYLLSGGEEAHRMKVVDPRRENVLCQTG